MKRKDKTSNYKPAMDRAKDLKLAIYAIQKGRAQSGETKVTIAAVAREAGVSTALIHNHYPSIAEEIRQIQGRSSRAMRDVKHQDLIAERQKSKGYRQEIEELEAKLAKIASINEVLMDENQKLKTQLRERNVVELVPSSRTDKSRV
ncbi:MULTISPECIES: TetR family transcriptional regulator [Pseudomonas]|jgi:AcrR family transcriptional regulator|uniref:Regulatory protein, tetR family n=1 Tax=Pseudomonas extremorientalis TaxID=169669 RepID=A0A1H0PYK5_9PSED|nr:MULTISPECIES: TetR family transcriptional regulator [Pseudomonas]MEE4092533.1 TetR family transcriptional regulator [Pseudomonas viridiflava]KAB0522018.1 TetR family transcriptional regulator [Pseudomonas extremorientalis]MBP0951872.1 TetR family transcriptional regulator [Pseudomonas alliivorans]OIN10800.1 TetR family transcriptional regulator [Pseudomonas extremorientalis]SDP09586.1 regulatory protein, tetR family [Pseudomonas extremorientalis]